jgi:L-lactate dehydrogenase complex protein LldE
VEHGSEIDVEERALRPSTILLRERPMRVALFLTCVNDGLFPNTGRAVVEVLESLGHDVVFPTQQTCCGQLHLNAGYQREGLHVAEQFRRVFDPYDFIVSPSASCVGTVRESYGNAAREIGDPRLQADVQELAGRVYEFSEFLTNVLHVTDVGARFPHRVAYHPTCHSLRTLHLSEGPVDLLRGVKDLVLVDFAGSDQCCGFGGTFALKNAATSVAIGADKVASVEGAGAEVLCALDNSCLTHIGGVSSRAHSKVRTMHLAEILAAKT